MKLLFTQRTIPLPASLSITSSNSEAARTTPEHFPWALLGGAQEATVLLTVLTGLWTGDSLHINSIPISLWKRKAQFFTMPFFGGGAGGILHCCSFKKSYFTVENERGHVSALYPCSFTEPQTHGKENWMLPDDLSGSGVCGILWTMELSMQSGSLKTKARAELALQMICLQPTGSH